MKYLLPLGTPKGQKEAVNANEKLITVGAGAGTGKTWVLSQRYLRLLIDDDELLPKDILTLTYTEAAAEEMKERIQNLIEKELDRFDNEERRREIEDGLSDLWISTIHSFSSRLIRESGLKLDIDPMASVIDMHVSQNFWEDIKNAAEFANLRVLARAYGDEKLNEIARSLDTGEDREYFSAAVSKWKADKLSLFAQRVSELHASSGFTWENMLEWAENDTLIDGTRPCVEKILCKEWQAVWDIWKDIELPRAANPNGPGGRLNALLDWRDFQASRDKETLRKFYDVAVRDKTIRANRFPPFPTLKEYLNGQTLGEWRETRSALIQEITPNYENDFSEQELMMRKVLMKFCALSWGMWSMMKQRRGFLSFSDMISHAKSIIDNKGINRTFRHILVDEFQDTDTLQYEMIDALSDYSEDTGLFAVGDPKQSIYKFRYADPSLFAQMTDDALRKGKKVELDTSFRTRESLLTRINSLFASIWPDTIAEGMNVRFEPLSAAENQSERDSGTMPDFRIILAQNDSKSKEAQKKLADVLAREIAKYVHEGFTIWDKEEKRIRPVMFSDFAILARSRSCFDVLEDALSSYNIKSVRDKSDEYFSRGEIGDIVCMLRAAADMNDSFALSGWVMSPFSGVKEEEAVKSFLQELSSNRNEQKPSEILKANLPEAYSKLEYLSLVGELEGPAGLLYLYDKNRSWLSCYPMNDRLRVLRNFRFAISIARDFQSTGTSGLIACAEWLNRAVRNELSIEEPAWHDKDENAVRLGAVHSAKGLEYPVTIIFEHRTSKNVDRDSLRPSKNLGLVFGDMPDEILKDEKLKSQGILWERLLSQQGDSEEETRLFYVAATRAQDSLIFCGLVDKNGQAYKDTWTKLMLDNVRNVNLEYADEVDDSESPEVIADESNESKRILDVLSVKNSLRQISATSFSLFEFCPFSWRRSYRQGINLQWEYDVHDDNDDYDSGGADLGSLAHWVLSQWPKDDDYLSELDTLLTDRYSTFDRLPVRLRGAWRDENGRMDLHEWLKRFTESELFMKLRNENIRREFRFRYKLNESTALAGAIDALYGNNIIDYKITRFDSVPPGLYESQLDFYALAMHDMFNYESVNTSTVFLKEGRIVQRVCSDFDSIRERIRIVAEICASGPYNARIENCSKCPFRKGCMKYAE